MQTPSEMKKPDWQVRQACDDRQVLQPVGHDVQLPLPGYEPDAHIPYMPVQAQMQDKMAK